MRSYYQKNNWQKNQRGKIAPSILVVLASIILGIIYLMQVNSGVTKGYKIRERLEALKEAQKIEQELRVQAAQWQSLPNMEELIDSLKMVEVEKISYLNIPDNGMAVVK